MALVIKMRVKIVSESEPQIAADKLAQLLQRGWTIAGQSQCPPSFYTSGEVRFPSVITWTLTHPGEDSSNDD